MTPTPPSSLPHPDDPPSFRVRHGVITHGLAEWIARVGDEGVMTSNPGFHGMSPVGDDTLGGTERWAFVRALDACRAPGCGATAWVGYQAGAAFLGMARLPFDRAGAATGSIADPLLSWMCQAPIASWILFLIRIAGGHDPYPNCTDPDLIAQIPLHRDRASAWTALTNVVRGMLDARDFWTRPEAYPQEDVRLLYWDTTLVPGGSFELLDDTAVADPDWWFNDFVDGMVDVLEQRARLMYDCLAGWGPLVAGMERFGAEAPAIDLDLVARARGALLDPVDGFATKTGGLDRVRGRGVSTDRAIYGAALAGLERVLLRSASPEGPLAIGTGQETGQEADHVAPLLPRQRVL